MSDNKHENYHLLNLIGYGLAKFDMDFVNQFNFNTKVAFYNHLIKIGVAETVGVIKNRQDLFDPFFDNERKGWWQKGDAYIHRKDHIDSLFGDLSVREYSDVISLYLQGGFLNKESKEGIIKPIIKSKFKQLQETGVEAELFFMKNYSQIIPFKNGIIEDARLYGDGYDFQIIVESQYFLAEVKGVKDEVGSVRMTEKEFMKANEYKDEYALSVVSNLFEKPKISVIFNPINNLDFSVHESDVKQVTYNSKSINWKNAGNYS